MSLYLDASVLVALFIDDPFSERADKILRGRMAMPAVSDYAKAEFASSIARHVRTGGMKAAEARKTFVDFDGWTDRSATRVQTTPADIATAELALRRLDLTLRAPDAIHIAIAHRIGADLVTFDEKMGVCARALGVKVTVS